MLDLSDFIVQENDSVLDATTVINANGKQIVFVCDGMRLLASFTDGDIRRFILRAGDLKMPVSEAANYNPKSLKTNEVSKAQHLFASNPYIRGVPILNESGEIVSVVLSESIMISHKHTQLDVPVVIMAGGKGTRLAPYTDVLPKPLIPIGNMTITEHIIEHFGSFGCDNFTMIVNHKKELVKAYFSETSYNGDLSFIDEKEFLGTGGGLKLLEGHITDTFFMTNCDILVEADYEDLLKHHKKNKAVITMVCALKKVSVPYGTVELDDNGSPVKIIEKPEYPILTNTGLYVVEPSFFEVIPSDTFVHITDLIQKLMDDGETVGVYPISENQWSDMGHPDEMKKMISMQEMM